MDGAYGTKKFAAIPINEVAVKFDQNHIPFTSRFIKVLIDNNDKIIGNKALYLSNDEIKYLI